MDIDIPMLDAVHPESGGGSNGSFADYVEQNLLDNESVFSFPVIQPTAVEVPINIHPERAMLMSLREAPTTTDDERACQAVCSDANSFGEPRPASRRDFDFEGNSAYPSSSPRRRRIRSRTRSHERPLYPDYWTPHDSRRDRPYDRSRRAEELFEDVSVEEKSLAVVVSSMTDMDIGRDDRYRGSGYRGGNKRRRDGKL